MTEDSRVHEPPATRAPHQPLVAAEAAKLYEELLSLMKEDAERRKKATQFASHTDDCDDQPGPADSAGPERGCLGEARRRTAQMVTSKASYARLEQILQMEQITADPSTSVELQQVAESELEAIRNGGAVDPSYHESPPPNGWRR